MKTGIGIVTAPLVLVAAIAAGCGGGSPTAPSGGAPAGPAAPSGGGSTGGGSSSCGGAAVGPLGCAMGLMTGAISGTPFTGGVPTGFATYTTVAAQPGAGLPALDFILIQGTSADLTSLTITARAKTGTAPLGMGVIDAEIGQPTLNNANLTTRANGQLAGAWNTNTTGGSGTITINSVSTTAATGSYELTMVPQPGTGASGDRVVTGTFTVTF